MWEGVGWGWALDRGKEAFKIRRWWGYKIKVNECKNILKGRGRGEKDKGIDYRERNKLEKVEDTKLIYRQFKKKR